ARGRGAAGQAVGGWEAGDGEARLACGDPEPRGRLRRGRRALLVGSPAARLAHGPLRAGDDSRTPAAPLTAARVHRCMRGTRERGVCVVNASGPRPDLSVSGADLTAVRGGGLEPPRPISWALAPQAS